MPDYQKELVGYRLQTAQEKLHSVKILLDAGEYKDSIGRSYLISFWCPEMMLWNSMRRRRNL